jgi:hypothetical protein
MIENNDTEVFNFEKSEISEDRSYFEKGKLFHQIRSHKTAGVLSQNDMTQEQKRITENYERLIDLLKSK